MSSYTPGAVPQSDGTQFTVFALGHDRVDLVIEGSAPIPLAPLGDGYFGAKVAEAGVGTRYGFSIDGGPVLHDPASRWQPEGLEGLSEVVDPTFAWTDADWPGVTRHDQILYQLHLGTFTPQGTWRAAQEQLPRLAELGITLIQVLPVASFKAETGWGYDGALLFAPHPPYGTPDDMRAFIDAAHGLGLGVILDVVYNHVGIGDRLRDFSEHYFHDDDGNEWGSRFNLDTEGAQGARDYFTANAAYWIKDFHLDGFRLDATQALVDESPRHIIADIAAAAREAAGERSLFIVAENLPQDRRLTDAPEAGGYGLDAIVADDYHHAVLVAATGHSDHYYGDYAGTPQELLSAIKYGFLYQGERSHRRDAAFGTYNLDKAPEQFVHFLENHDQVANSTRGFRLAKLTSPSRLRALTAMLLLGPQTPMLFQGQEWGSTRPFYYFFGVKADEAKSVEDGRLAALRDFHGFDDPVMRETMARASQPETFTASKLDHGEAERNAGMVALHRDLIALRRGTAAFSQRARRWIDGAVIGPGAFLVRYTTDTPEEDRLLLINLGPDVKIGVLAEPLLAPPPGRKWVRVWSSEHPDYDGLGRVDIDTDTAWALPADCALVLAGEVRA